MIRSLVVACTKTMAGGCPVFGSGVRYTATRSVATASQKTIPPKMIFKNKAEEERYFRDVSWLFLT